MSRSVPAHPFLLATALLAAACRTTPAGSASARLDALVRAEWRERLADDPLLATRVGCADHGSLLPDVGPESRERRVERARRWLDELARIDLAELSEGERISHAMLTAELEDRLAEHAFGQWQLPWTSDSGFHTELARLPEIVPLADGRDYAAYLERLRAIPRYVDQEIANLRVGLERGMTLPRAILDGFEGPLLAQVVEDPTASLFYVPFRTFPDGVAPAERAALAAAGRRAVETDVVPAYQRLLRFFVDEYRPGARATLAASALPDGAAYYRHCIRHYTTLELDPLEVHRIGLAEVARIEGEMRALTDELGFEGTLGEFVAGLRSDPRFFAQSAAELLAHAERITERAQACLPALFGRLPRRPCRVAPVPDDLAPRYTGGRYVPAPRGSTKPGTYWVNTFALESRPLYTLPALTLHEAVPGHHLQIALAAEREDLPEFRRAAYVDAFGEGWGLYAEWLGIEMGIYRDPYEHFGRLSYEMWRAARLVIDTGLHALGWSREQAVDFLSANTALSLHECATEVDRYLSWPGQALAYKLGELELRDLRRRAEERLGARFDVRAFHDLVLEAGTLPLPLLRERVEGALEGLGSAPAPLPLSPSGKRAPGTDAASGPP